MHPFEIQISLQDAFHGKLALSVCSNGACKATEKANFLIWEEQLVVRGTKRWDFESDNNDNEKDWSSKNQTYNSGGDDEREDGGQGRGHGAPRAVTAQTRA